MQEDTGVMTLTETIERLRAHGGQELRIEFWSAIRELIRDREYAEVWRRIGSHFGDSDILRQILVVGQACARNATAFDVNGRSLDAGQL